VASRTLPEADAAQHRADENEMTSTLDGDLDIHSEITITGTVKGSIMVHRGGVLVLLGVAEGGVVVAGGHPISVIGSPHRLAGAHLTLNPRDQLPSQSSAHRPVARNHQAHPTDEQRG